MIALNCRVIAGIPFPTVSWVRHDGAPISYRFEQISSGSLYALNATNAEAGVYECHAANKVGTVIKTTSISFQMPLPPLITISPNVPQITVNEGDQLNLICSADGSPLPIVQWLRTNGIPISSSYSSNSVTSIRKIQVDKKDEGTYICNAINEAGLSEEKIDVFVKPKPKPPQQHKLLVGDTAKITCQLIDSDKKLKWMREDGKALPSSTSFDGGYLVRLLHFFDILK